MKNDTILLNGIVYNKDNFHQLHIPNEPETSWQNSIYHFLQNWFDDSDFILAQTSGSTGQPKEIRLPKLAMRNSAKMTNQYFELDANKTALLCLPASYIAGKMMLVRALVGGFNLIAVEPKANPFEGLHLHIDFTAITPYQLMHSVESLKVKDIRKIIVGGSPVTAKLEKLSESVPAELSETYGMTETSSHIALRRFNGSEKSDHFTVLGGVSIRQDERECLVIKVPHLFEGEINTNDMVELVGTKSFRWLGRVDSVINSGGVKIHPEQVEKKLEGIIRSNYFISFLPDEKLDNQIILVVESEKYSLQQLDDLKVELNSVLNRFEVPKEFFFLPVFVYSAGNKILRKETLAKAILLSV